METIETLRARLDALCDLQRAAFDDTLPMIAAHLNDESFGRFSRVDKRTREALRPDAAVRAAARAWRRVLERSTWIAQNYGREIRVSVYDHARQCRRGVRIEVARDGGLITYGELATVVTSALTGANRVALRGVDVNGPVDANLLDWGYQPIGLWNTAPTIASKAQVLGDILTCVAESTQAIRDRIQIGEQDWDEARDGSLEAHCRLRALSYSQLTSDQVVPNGTIFFKDGRELYVCNYPLEWGPPYPFDCGVVHMM